MAFPASRTAVLGGTGPVLAHAVRRPEPRTSTATTPRAEAQIRTALRLEILRDVAAHEPSSEWPNDLQTVPTHPLRVCSPGCRHQGISVPARAPYLPDDQTQLHKDGAGHVLVG